eukprot:7675694-Alexandrium_andersonii.AAC.1
MAADFHLRFSRRVSEYPWKVFWLVHVPCDEPSKARQAIATELQTLRDDMIGSQFVVKLRRTFAGELARAAADGTLDGELWHLLRSVGRAIGTDTQQLEGVNSMVKHMTKLAPNMKLRLLSSRVVIKKTLSDSLRTKGERERLVQFAIEHHAGAKALVDLPG